MVIYAHEAALIYKLSVKTKLLLLLIQKSKNNNTFKKTSRKQKKSMSFDASRKNAFNVSFCLA